MDSIDNRGHEVIYVVVILAIAFAILTALTATFTDSTVSSNWLSGVRNSSKLVGAILFIAMATLALAVVKYVRWRGN